MYTAPSQRGNDQFCTKFLLYDKYDQFNMELWTSFLNVIILVIFFPLTVLLSHKFRIFLSEKNHDAYLVFGTFAL